MEFITSPPSQSVVAAGLNEQLSYINQSMSTYIADSELMKLNKTAKVGHCFEVSEELFGLIKQAKAVAAQTNNAYDVTVGPLVDLWGFGPTQQAVTVAQLTRWKPPTRAEVDTVRAQVGFDAVTLHQVKQCVTFAKPVQLDLSSIAKGYGVDRLTQHLRELGFTRSLVEIGGEVFAQGEKPRPRPWLKAQPWQIGIERPNGEIQTIQSIALRNQGVATSGDYRNYRESKGQRYSHIIDPRTGEAKPKTLHSVSVVHESAALADAWATALMVLGEHEAKQLAKRLQLKVLLVFESKTDQGLQTWASDHFALSNLDP